MKNQQQHIVQFELSPLARAGVFIIDMKNHDDRNEHDVNIPHRDNHYLLLMATQGNFRLNLDFEELSVAAPAMLLIFPGQVHHIIEINDPHGWGISFDPLLVDNEFKLVLERGFKHPMLLDAQSAFAQQAATLMGMIEQIQQGVPDAYTGRSTHALLASLLSLIAGKITTPTIGNKTKESRAKIIEQGFSQLLKQHYVTWKQPSQYAEALNISVSHLNDMVKGITGMPVSMHIQKNSILEAKRLLYFTDLSVKEIGYQLGYDEPVYFGKLFKKVSGFTPLEFRQKFRD